MSIFTSLIAVVLVGSTSVLPPVPSVVLDSHENIDRDTIENILEEQRYKMLIESRSHARENIYQMGQSGTFLYLPVPEELIPEERIVFPVGEIKISSEFGPRPKPCDACSSYHKGTDFTPGYGKPVYAMADGVVVDVGFNSVGYGRYIYIEHVLNGEKYLSAYAHLERWTMLVEEGDTVSAGQEIGSVGNTGTSTGPHLHFEVRDSEGEFLDPMVFLNDNNAEVLSE